MKKIAALLLLLAANLTHAATFNLFSPATGVLKGSASTYVTTPAVAADIYGLWSGTCSSAAFLRGDGTCAAAFTAATGILVGTSGSAVTTAATSANVTGLWSGTCDTTSFLRGDGACAQVTLSTDVTGTLPAANGGTGQSSYTAGNLLYASGTTALSKLAPGTSAQILHSGTTPSWAAVALATEVSGNLPVANLNSGTLASSTTFWRGDGTWSAAFTAATGILVGTSGSAVTTAATSANVTGLWSGTCDTTSFLRGDGACSSTLTSTMTAGAFAPTSSSAPTNGMYLPVANGVGLATNGTLRQVYDSSGRLLVGLAQTVSANVAGTAHQFQLAGTSTATAGQSSVRFSNDNAAPLVDFGKSRGTALASYTTVTAGDALGQIRFAGADGTDLSSIAAVVRADAEGTISTGVVPGIIRMQTANAAGTLTEALQLNSSQQALLADGTVSLPSGSYRSDVDTGTYRSGTNAVGIAGNGAQIANFTTTGVTVTGLLTTTTGVESLGTKFTATGCSNGTTVGGATAGSFNSGTTGTCAVVIALPTAANGWACHASDITTPANLISQSAKTTTSCTVTGTTVSGDTIVFSAMAY